MKPQTTERPKQITVNVTGVIIGDCKFKHDLSVPNPASELVEVRRKEIEGDALTWLTKQYPGREKSFSDVVVRIPDEQPEKKEKRKRAIHG